MKLFNQIKFQQQLEKVSNPPENSQKIKHNVEALRKISEVLKIENAIMVLDYIIDGKILNSEKEKIESLNIADQTIQLRSSESDILFLHDLRYDLFINGLQDNAVINRGNEKLINMAIDRINALVIVQDALQSENFFGASKVEFNRSIKTLKNQVTGSDDLLLEVIATLNQQDIKNSAAEENLNNKLRKLRSEYNMSPF